MRRLQGEFRTSERHVCELMAVPRSSCRYRSRRDDSQLEQRLRELARDHPRFGYRRLYLYLREEMVVNHKKVQRVYRELGLTVKRIRRKRLSRILRPQPVLSAPNQEWGIDFASDVTGGGQRFRVLSVIDNFTRQCPVLETSSSFPSRRLTRELERAIAAYGKPQAIRCDNGPELTSRHFLARAIKWKIDLVHIQPGKPTQNAGVESFNGKLRDECLNVNWFWTCSTRGERSPVGGRSITRAVHIARWVTWPRTSLHGSGALFRLPMLLIGQADSRVNATLTGSAALRH